MLSSRVEHVNKNKNPKQEAKAFIWDPKELQFGSTGSGRNTVHWPQYCVTIKGALFCGFLFFEERKGNYYMSKRKISCTNKLTYSLAMQS